MQHPRITTRIYSIHPESPRYTLGVIEDLIRSVNFNFDSPDGKLTIKLPRFTQDRFGRSCHLNMACFCEGIYELRAVPIYWPRENPTLVRAYHNRPKRG